MEVWKLYRQGLRPLEIAQKLQIPYHRVSGAVTRGRSLGLLPMKQTYTLSYIMQMRSITMGRMGRDVVHRLSREQQNWLVDKAAEMGCETVAEYITEMIRDDYEREASALDGCATGKKETGR